jgi:hypothetical protein
MGPYGMSLPSSKPIAGRGRKKKFAAGGASGEPTPIVAAGGEVVIPPEKIAERFECLGDLRPVHS